MVLDFNEVERRRKQDPHGRCSTSEIEREVARDQVIRMLGSLRGNTLHPHVEVILDVLEFAFEKGVL